MKKKQSVISELDLWLKNMVREHYHCAGEGTWDASGVTTYYAECRKIHLKQGVVTVLTRDVDYNASGKTKSPSLNQCYNLSVASFSPVNMMPESHRQDMAVRIVRTMFWPHAGRVFVDPPRGLKGSAGDIWNYRLFVTDKWTFAKLSESDEAELKELGMIPFGEIQAAVVAGNGG